MAVLTESFDAASLPKSDRNFDPLPEGWYTASITGAEIKKTKDGTGEYIDIRYDITGPTHQGRVVFGNLNIKNQNPKAEEIGRQQLGELMRAIGLARVTDTDQLIGGSLGLKLVIVKSEQYGNSNNVKGFKSLATGPKINGASSPSAPSTPAAPAKAAPPWAKK
jgi:Protein of unknown function (DUF669)